MIAESDWRRLRELHQQLEELDAAIEDAIASDDKYAHVVHLCERAWTYMVLRDRLGKPTPEGKRLDGLMWADLKIAQSIVAQVRRS